MNTRRDPEEHRLRTVAARAAAGLAVEMLEGHDRRHEIGQAAERLQDAFEAWRAWLGETDDA